MSTAAATRGLRIGELAARAGTTPRTVRYYEEIGLLEPHEERAAGRHRLYTEADLERVREVLRLKDLLGLSLDELKQIVEAEDARAALRAEWAHTTEPSRRAGILHEALGHLGQQLALVRRRRAQIDALEQELEAKRRRIRARLRELDAAERDPD
jgi:MerR family transcriptional regulator, repressor of the yfmOP operon